MRAKYWGHTTKFMILAALTAMLNACGDLGELKTTTNTRVSPAYADGPAEKAFCGTVTNYSTPVTITLTATYQKRVMDSDGVGTDGLGNAGALLPIRRAEVQVYDQSGNTIQCGETDASGNVSLQIPSSTSSHSVRVFSRADNTYLKASVLDAPETNTLYYIETTFTPDSSKSIAVNAGVTGDVEGGAFNILDQILDANDFLRSKVGGFTVAPKVSAYWQKGFNPNSYFGSPNSGVSFYLPSYSRLFILGGIGGDIDNEDTDHFDDSVILHEYGHFLEDVYSITDSPGGAHSGNKQIDPRLAWSEGWGNFFQAAVRGSSEYIDSYGVKTSAGGNAGGLFFNIPLEDPEPTCMSFESGCDIPTEAYEGNFREFAVARFFWDVFDSGSLDSDADGVEDEFAELWDIMTTATYGLKNTSEEFRNAGLVVEAYQDNGGGAGWNGLIADVNSRLNDTNEYATYVDNIGGTCNFTMDPLWDATEDSGSFSTSFLLQNNDFYFYKHSGGNINLILNYSTDDPTNPLIDETDLDLFIYNTSARYGNSNDIVGSSQQYFDDNPLTPETETISKNLPAGDYLINVKVYTGTNATNSSIGSIDPDERIPAGDALTYSLTTNGVSLCKVARP